MLIAPRLLLSLQKKLINNLENNHASSKSGFVALNALLNAQTTFNYFQIDVNI